MSRNRHRLPARWKLLLLVILAGLVLLVLFAPTLVAHPPVLNWLARQALDDMQGNLTVGDASLGWLAPVVLRDVQIHDLSGRTLLSAPGITSSKTLLSLLVDRSDLGTFFLEQPTLSLAFAGQQSNLEQLLDSL